MLLKKIGIYGFKSFADKIMMEFNSGITAIVGPNGSGKSNVADAVLWVLGEQSAKLLRGEKMEDIIFAGADKRKKSGMAEVKLTFDNKARNIKIDLDEISVGRRIFRSGESEYFINKTNCRLKDITELLSGIGISRETMTVIGQNRIDTILNSKPEERRIIFEEMAGIGKYKQRKKESIKKLDETILNATRIDDIISELNEQIESVKEKADKAEQYQKLFLEKKEIHTNIIMQSCYCIKSNLELLESNKEADEKISNNLHDAIKESEEEKYAISECIDNLEKLLNMRSAELSMLQDEANAIQQEILLSTERHSQLNVNVAKLLVTQKNTLDEKQQVVEKINQFNRNKLDVNNNKAVINTKLQNNKELFEKCNSDIKIIEQYLAEDNEEKFSFMHDLIGIRNNIKQLLIDKEKFEQQGKVFTQKENELSLEIKKKTHESNKIQEHIDQVKKELLQLKENLHGQRNLLLKKQKNILSKDEQINSNEKKLHEIDIKTKMLNNLQTEYEGFSKTTKNIFKNIHLWKNQICGTVAELINVPYEYILATEVILGNNLQNIIVENDSIAKSVISFLKNNNYGRATLLPINMVHARDLNIKEKEAVNDRSSLGLLIDKISFSPKYGNIIKYLLGNVIMAKDLDTATAIAKKYRSYLRIVTLTGEIIQPSGAMIGGSAPRKESGYLGRKDELLKLEIEYQDLFKRQILLKEQVDVLKGEEIAIADLINSYELQEKKLDIELINQMNSLNNLLADISNLNINSETLRLELRNIEQEITLTQQKYIDFNITLEKMQKEEKNIKATSDEKRKELQNLQMMQGTLRQTIEEQNILLAELKQQVQAIGGNLNISIAEKERIENRHRSLVNEITENRSKIENLENTINKSSAESVLKINAIRELDTLCNDLRAKKVEAAAKMRYMDKSLKEMQKKKENLLFTIHKSELQITSLYHEFHHQEEVLKDSYGLRLTDIQSCSDTPMLNEKQLSDLQLLLNRLEYNITELGHIDIGAIEIYNSFLTRYNFLLKQKEDLTNALNDLNEIIFGIDKKMTHDFMHAWQKINDFFAETFTALFGGGKASVQLTDTGNPLTSGIEIYAQPPGKKTEALQLLSGGERALTVIALLFSFLKFSPAPFCVLDELDAALDEINVKRFSDFMQHHANQTQFIIITHRKLTMEAADVLYGVTMEDSGISKVLSVKLNYDSNEFL